MTIRLFRLLSLLCFLGSHVGFVLAQSNPLNPYAINTTPAQGKTNQANQPAQNSSKAPAVNTQQPQSTSAVPGSGSTMPSSANGASSSTTNNTNDISAQPVTQTVTSDAFGANLFTGAFTRQGPLQFNPNYTVSTGDSIQVRLWGAFTFDAQLVVDPKGNIFLPHVGPVQMLGVKNQDIQRVVDSAVATIFKSSVYSYASLAAAQPVRVFVSGFVNRPGMYAGTSMDSLLHYLDQAGGIDTERGSFLNVQVKRGQQIRATVNLYDFLLQGTTPAVQLADGDVILVSTRQNTLMVTGLTENPKRFEFATATKTLADIMPMAKPRAQATHARITRNTGTKKSVEYYPLGESTTVVLANGDEVEFTADKKPGTITVRVEGEHQSSQEYVLPYGTRMGALLEKIEFSERSETESLQLFRLSVKERQRQSLQVALKSLETAALTARSGTSDEARLRAEEAGLILQWVERAKAVEPRGQVVIPETSGRNDLLLENGDVIRVPMRDGLVLVNGEVLFPNAITHETKLNLQEYIKRAGGFTQNADAARILIAHKDGSFTEADQEEGFFKLRSKPPKVKAGDEILVLPKLDVKSRQIWKDLTQIIFQIAVSAKVVLGL
jgi:protein involved in polysaccharide export with SLBB domain